MEYVCLFVKRDSVFVEISSSSTSSLWADITQIHTIKTSNRVVFLLFYTQIMQSIFEGDISSRVHQDALRQVFSHSIRKCIYAYVCYSAHLCPSAFATIYNFFLGGFAFVICEMNGCRGQIFPMYVINMCVCVYVLTYIFLFLTFVYALSQWKF